MTVRAYSGLPADQVTIERALSGGLSQDDLRIAPAQLECQAVTAQAVGNTELAENLRRAAELARLSDTEVLEIYESLRPGRATGDELRATASRLAQNGMPRCAALLLEAEAVYGRRRLLG